MIRIKMCEQKEKLIRVEIEKRKRISEDTRISEYKNIVSWSSKYSILSQNTKIKY